VRGPGFRFRAPAGWNIDRVVTGVVARPAGGPQALVSVRVFTLRNPYHPSQFALAARELDRVAAELVARSSAKLTERATATVDGTRIRAYRFEARPANGRGYDARIGFLLQGKREYELYCQDAPGMGDADGACALLFSSFGVV
jgi:hypothetical protein